MFDEVSGSRISFYAWKMSVGGNLMQRKFKFCEDEEVPMIYDLFVSGL